ncbi:PAS domain S-box-containing protein [Sphingobium sp. AP50]|uniref:PAS domain-containing sensor histidine kinase n=1 Tax=Sphingobium sp. AP50 TaxID=1884369 RepID=UPI0008B6BAF2|nr:ATP-binding protein [Sphingobium sp. AP50]SEJ81508.1 PAS domain S-box-containing protein [Sphingobium sp. AP50]
MDDGSLRIDGGDYVRSTSDAVPALISFFDAEHICRYANDHHALWYGRAAIDLVGLHMREFLGSDAYDMRREHLDRVAAGEQVSFEASVPYLDGTARDAAIRYVPRIGPLGFEGFHTLVFDLTREQHRYHSVFDGTAVGFWEIDLTFMRRFLDEIDGTVPDLRAHIEADLSVVRKVLDITPVLDLNEKACRMFGVERTSAIGRTMGDWSPAGSLDAWNRVMLNYLAGAESYETETVLERADGTPIDILISCAYPKRPDEQVIVVVGLVDISSRVAKEKELARVQADLTHAARVATLGELMASIAHEVNQPLAAVVANGNAALRWLDRDVDEAKAAISRMMSEATRASEIIARTRRMAVKGETTPSEFDLNQMISESVDITRRQASGLGAHVIQTLAPDLPLVAADRIQLQQVIINLIVNAAQAMAEQTEARLIEIRSGQQSRDAVQIEVADTGPGFGEHAGRVFEAFYTTKKDGMGMGLSVAKGIIEAHGGVIDAQPRSGRGTVFRIDIPLGDMPVCEGFPVLN